MIHRSLGSNFRKLALPLHSRARKRRSKRKKYDPAGFSTPLFSGLREQGSCQIFHTKKYLFC